MTINYITLMEMVDRRLGKPGEQWTEADNDAIDAAARAVAADLGGELISSGDEPLAWRIGGEVISHVTQIRKDDAESKRTGKIVRYK